MLKRQLLVAGQGLCTGSHFSSPPWVWAVEVSRNQRLGGGGKVQVEEGLSSPHTLPRSPCPPGFPNSSQAGRGEPGVSSPPPGAPRQQASPALGLATALPPPAPAGRRPGEPEGAWVRHSARLPPSSRDLSAGVAIAPATPTLRGQAETHWQPLCSGGPQGGQPSTRSGNRRTEDRVPAWAWGGGTRRAGDAHRAPQGAARAWPLLPRSGGTDLTPPRSPGPCAPRRLV